MHLFFCPDIIAKTYTLNEEESKHCIRVLRLTEGDRIYITDGAGALHETVITQADPRKCSVKILKTEVTARNSPEIHIAIAPPKNIERFEWFLEKSTEIGISEITPLICEHSERTVLKPQRLVKILASAMKQSLRTFLPQMHDASCFLRFVTANFQGQKFIANCITGNEALLLKRYEAGKDAIILIGPEGDFSKEELDLAVENGYVPVSLGPSRLRTETAGIVACHTFALANLG